MIKVNDLCKTFGSKIAVDQVTFNVEKGEVLGFLGPNGAGKSTTMRMITGYYVPDAGRVSINGVDALVEPVKSRRRLGYLPENAPLYPDMSVWSFLKFCAELRGLYGKACVSAVDRVLEMCFLETVRNQSVDTLSKGFKHRTCFAQSIIHDPDVLILDEPTDGLDPNQKHEIRNLIKRMGERKAIILSTHILEEVEAVCTRAIIIDQGKVVADATPADLKQRSPHANRVLCHISGAATELIQQSLAQLSGVLKWDTYAIDDTKSFRGMLYAESAEGSKLLASRVAELVLERRWKALELHCEEGRLDEVFRQLTHSEQI